MLISPLLTNNNQDNNSYNQLLKDIDGKIADIAGVQFLNDINGFKNKVNMCLANKLYEYKEIMLDLLIGCNCLNDEHILFVTSRIYKLLDTQ